MPPLSAIFSPRVRLPFTWCAVPLVSLTVKPEYCGAGDSSWDTIQMSACVYIACTSDRQIYRKAWVDVRWARAFYCMYSVQARLSEGVWVSTWVSNYQTLPALAYVQS